MVEGDDCDLRFWWTDVTSQYGQCVALSSRAQAFNVGLKSSRTVLYLKTRNTSLSFFVLDYDAPLSEAGDYTPKYHLLRDLLAISTVCDPLSNESSKNENVLTLRPSKFVSLSKLIWRNVALHHLVTNWNGSEWVPSEWESKQLIKTSQ